jgi:hypothetical protein
MAMENGLAAVLGRETEPSTLTVSGPEPLRLMTGSPFAAVLA